MNTVLQDIRYAVRLLVRNPGFSAVAVLTLAIGIGANTAIFSMVKGILLDPLPYSEPDELVMVWQDYTERSGRLREWWSWENFSDVRAQSSNLADVAVYTDNSRTLSRPEGARAIPTASVSANMLRLLGVAPVEGRSLSEEDGEPGADPVAVVSHAFWQEQMGLDQDAIGSSLTLDGVPTVVVGVMPRGFPFPFTPEPALWEPLRFPNGPPGRGNVWLRAVGRLTDGASLETAQAELATIGDRLAQEYPGANASTGIIAFPLLEELTGSVADYLYVLLAAVGLVLLIACANVANLLLARGTARSTEIAVRSALGAGRGRIIMQLVVESLVISAVSTAAGLLVAVWGVDALKSLVSGAVAVPRLQDVGMDPGVLLFSLGLAALTALLFGLIPALGAARTDLRSALVSGGRGGSGVRRTGRLRSGLVVVEVALSLVLLGGAALLVQSLVRLTRVEPGFQADGLLTFEFFLPGQRYGDADSRRGFLESLEPRLAAMPGVEGVAMTSTIPFTDYNTDLSFLLEGRPEPEPGQEPAAWYRQVSTRYFDVMGIPLLEGRGFTPDDRAGSERVAVVNRAFAERYYPQGGAVGGAMVFGSGTRVPITGMVGDIRSFGLAGDSPPAFYLHAPQFPPAHMGFVVRTSTDPVSLMPSVRGILTELDEGLAPVGASTMRQKIRDSVTTDRVAALLLAVFALAAVILAAVGLYGVMSYQVSSRRREIGIRMALGADAASVRRMVVLQGMALSVFGAVIGVAGALLLTGYLESLLFGIDPADPVTLVLTSLLLIGIGTAASWIPARRATLTDPVSALRSE